MQQEFENVKLKEFYLPPTCECVEVCYEGILCASDFHVSNGVFDSEGDRFVGEW